MTTKVKKWDAEVSLWWFDKRELCSCLVEFETEKELEAFCSGMKRTASLILGQVWNEEDLNVRIGPHTPVY